MMAVLRRLVRAGKLSSDAIGVWCGSSVIQVLDVETVRNLRTTKYLRLFPSEFKHLELNLTLLNFNIYLIQLVHKLF